MGILSRKKKKPEAEMVDAPILDNIPDETEPKVQLVVFEELILGELRAIRSLLEKAMEEDGDGTV